MPNVVVCFKWVIDEADVQVDERSHALKTDRAAHKISDYDRNAIEAGAQIIEELGGEMLAVSAGGPGAKTAFKDALSRGATCGLHICDEKLEDPDPLVSSKVLAAALDEKGPFDLVLFGEGSNDIYAQQVGERTAQLLDIPLISYACSIAIEGQSVRVERKLDDCIETVTCDMPVAITVSPACNKPRIPGMKQILAAGKKPFETVSPADIGVEVQGRPQTSSQREGSVMERQNVIIEGDAEEAAHELAGIISREGLA